MSENKTLREMLKVESLLMLLYSISSFIILIFFWNYTIKEDSIIYRKEIILWFVMLAVFVILILLLYCFKKNTSIIFLKVSTAQIILISIMLLRLLLAGYYKLHGKAGLKIILIYAIVAFILFVLCRDYHKKLPSEEELNKKEKPKVQRGSTYLASALVIAIARSLSMEEQQAVNTVVSLVIVCGWLAYAWLILELKKRYFDTFELKGSADEKIL